MNSMKVSSALDLRSIFSGNSGYIIGIYLLIVVFILASKLVSPSFGSIDHIRSILILSSLLVLIGFGQGLVILIGELDLSIGSLISLSAVLTAAWMGKGGATVFEFIFILAILAFIGFLNGVGVAYLKIPSFIMTLSSSLIVFGVILGLTGGTSSGSSPQFLSFIMTKQFAGIPISIILLVLITIVGVFIQSKSKLGRSLYAIGSNRKAALFAGISVNKYVIIVYVISALCAGLTGMLLVGFSSGATLRMGESYLLPSIAIVVVGGTSIAGGKGHFLGTVGAAIFLTTLQTVIQALDISQGWQTFVYGFMILAVLTFFRKDLYLLFTKYKGGGKNVMNVKKEEMG